MALAEFGKDSAKALVDEASTTLVPALQAAVAPIIERAVETVAHELSQLPADISAQLEGLTITHEGTFTISRKRPT